MRLRDLHRFGRPTVVTVKPEGARAGDPVVGRPWMSQSGPIGVRFFRQVGVDLTDMPLEPLEPERPVVSSTSPKWLKVATGSLQAWPKAPALLRVRTPPSTIAVDVLRFSHLMKHEYAGYSLEEIRRLMNEPRLTRQYVETVIRPSLELNRKVDRYGDEPHFLLAAQLAAQMLHAAPGTTEIQAVNRFLSDPNNGILSVWPEFTVDDVERLRALYPFIPSWPEGVKSATCLGVQPPVGLHSVTEALAGHVTREILALARIPMSHPTLEEVARVRGESGGMAGVRLVEGSGIFEDLVPRLEIMLAVDGLAGRDVTIVGKSYSSDRRVADVVRRVFGVNASIVDGENQAMLDAVKGAVRDVLADKSRSEPLVIHGEGVIGLWSSLHEERRARPDVQIINVSHTTSDGRDLHATVKDADSMLFEVMGLTAAKRRDERERFQNPLAGKLLDIEHALRMSLKGRVGLVMGYGGIMGPAMADAFRAYGMRYYVYDPVEARRVQARQEGHVTVDDIEPFYDLSPFIVEAAGTTVLSEEQLHRFTGNPMLMTIGSGRKGFAMNALERPGVGHRVEQRGLLGSLPIVDYVVNNGDRDGTSRMVRYTAIGDGYVGNLGVPSPSPIVHAINTPLLVWETIRQGLFNARHGMTGVHTLRSIDIELAEDGRQTRMITLHDRRSELPRGAESVRPSQRIVLVPFEAPVKPGESMRQYAQRQFGLQRLPEGAILVPTSLGREEASSMGAGYAHRYEVKPSEPVQALSGDARGPIHPLAPPPVRSPYEEEELRAQERHRLDAHASAVLVDERDPNRIRRTLEQYAEERRR